MFDNNQTRVDESLRNYLKRFNDLPLETPGISPKVKTLAFINGLREGHFFSSLAKRMAQTFDEHLDRVEKYIQLEDAIRVKEADVAARKEDKRSSPSNN